MKEKIDNQELTISPEDRWSNDQGKEITVKVIEEISKKPAVIDFLIITGGFGNIIKDKKDLAAINLTKQEFISVTLKNAFFAEGNFEGCVFSDVVLDNVDFTAGNFKKAKFLNVTLNHNCSISEANFEDAEIKNLVGLSDDTMKRPIKISRFRYRTSLFKILTKAFPKAKILFGKDHEGHKHTIFEDIKTEQINSSSNKELKEHINWYQHLLNQINNYDKRKKRYKFSLFMAIFFTNYWNAYRALALWAILLNASMASLIYFNPYIFVFNYGQVKPHWLTHFYYCIVTFTTLGYGDVSPLNWAAQIIAGIVAISGYIILGTLIYLMSRKADNKF